MKSIENRQTAEDDDADRNQWKDDDVASEEVEGEKEEEEVSEKKRNKSKENKMSGNLLYRLQLEEEERQLQRSRKGGAFFDDEAEEEEEEGHQAGLGDFGFGVTSKNKENEDEKAALKLRKGDLDHIVDSLSDDEGDEEAAVKFRSELQRKDDNERLHAVITGVTEGADAAKHRNRRQGFTFDELVGKTNALAAATAEGEEGGDGADVTGKGEEEELDFEEMLLRGMTDKMEREKHRRGRGRGGGYDDVSDDDEDEDGNDAYDTEEEMERMKDLFSTMTEEERRIEVENMQRRKEVERNEALRRKQMEKEFKIRRELRLQAKRQSQSSQSQSQSQSQVMVGDVSNPPYALKDVSDVISQRSLLFTALTSSMICFRLRIKRMPWLRQTRMHSSDRILGTVGKTSAPPLQSLPHHRSLPLPSP